VALGLGLGMGLGLGLGFINCVFKTLPLIVKIFIKLAPLSDGSIQKGLVPGLCFC
jgi:hypothetical protein